MKTIQFPVPYVDAKLPSDFRFSPETAAQRLGCSAKTVLRRTKLPVTDRYYLKASRNSPTGPITIFAYDLEDYLKRSQVGAERQEAA